MEATPVPSKRYTPVKLLRDTNGGLHIESELNGLHASIPVQFVGQAQPSLIGDNMGDQYLHKSKGNQQQVAMTIREFFMDYDDVAELYQNRRFNGGTTKQYMLNNLGVFTTSNDLKQIVWRFPEVDPTDLASWNPLPDNRKWPVFVRPPPKSLYPSGFGRGTAIRCKRGPSGMIYLVKKEPLQPADQYEVENPTYYGKYYQVPEFMICQRRMGVVSVDRSDDTVTFIRRGQAALITTVNEIRTLAPNTQDHMDRMVALIDVINDYPDQLADLLNPGEVQMSKGYQEYLSSQQESSDDSSSADASAASGSTYTPAYNQAQTPSAQAYRPAYQPQQQAPNPFSQYAQQQMAAPSGQQPPGGYPMTYSRR